MMIFLEFLIFFSLTLFLHEFGHYLAARLFGIRVEEFGFGFPPRLVRLFRVGGTEVTLNWIPFGAFVRLSGENDPSVPGGFINAKPLARIAVLLAGPFMNLMTGLVLFSLFFLRAGVPEVTKVMVDYVEPDSPAALAGIQPGDLVRQVNDVPITGMAQLSQIIAQHRGEEITLVVERTGQQITLRATPRLNPPPGQGALGIRMVTPWRPVTSWFETLPWATQATWEGLVQIPRSLIAAVRGEVPPEQSRVVGPVGIYTIFSQARERDIENEQAGASPVETTLTLRLMALISVAVGFANLLPIPALDGGRILFVLPELVIGKRVPPKYEAWVHTVGFVLLILLFLYITAQDIINPITLP
jgi:regulator of sigma E protease